MCHANNFQYKKIDKQNQYLSVNISNWSIYEKKNDSKLAKISGFVKTGFKQQEVVQFSSVKIRGREQGGLE